MQVVELDILVSIVVCVNLYAKAVVDNFSYNFSENCWRKSFANRVFCCDFGQKLSDLVSDDFDCFTRSFPLVSKNFRSSYQLIACQC